MPLTLFNFADEFRFRNSFENLSRFCFKLQISENRFLQANLTLELARCQHWEYFRCFDNVATSERRNLVTELSYAFLDVYVSQHYFGINARSDLRLWLCV